MTNDVGIVGMTNDFHRGGDHVHALRPPAHRRDREDPQRAAAPPPRRDRADRAPVGHAPTVRPMLDGTVDPDGLVAAVGDRAHFPDADRLVGELTGRGLLERRPTRPSRAASCSPRCRPPSPPTWHRSSVTSRPTTSPPPPACSTRWSAAPALPWPRRPRSPRDRRRRSAARLDRALETGGDDRGGHVAAGALEHGAQRVGRASEPAGQRVGIVDR